MIKLSSGAKKQGFDLIGNLFFPLYPMRSSVHDLI